ncbi:MAG: RloB family protein [Cyanobacteria bacterium J06614_10]
MTKRRNNYRGYSRRKVDNREIRQRFLIVCEGVETEPNYFKRFRVPKLVVDAKGLGVNPSQLVDKAKDLRKKDEYDQVWCVFDRDSFPEQDFNNAVKNALEEKFRVAYSNEAFEVWYILHFQYLNTGIDRRQYKQKLTQLLGFEYEKNSDLMYESLLDRQQVAIKNSTKLLEEYEPHNPAKNNPSTTVHLLVEELNKFIH